MYLVSYTAWLIAFPDLFIMTAVGSDGSEPQIVRADTQMYTAGREEQKGNRETT